MNIYYHAIKHISHHFTILQITIQTAVDSNKPYPTNGMVCLMVVHFRPILTLLELLLQPTALNTHICGWITGRRFVVYLVSNSGILLAFVKLRHVEKSTLVTKIFNTDFFVLVIVLKPVTRSGELPGGSRRCR